MCPSGSTVPVLFMVQVSTVQVAAKTAVGPVLPAGSVIVTSWVTVVNLPHTSVAVRVTVYVPGAA